MLILSLLACMAAKKHSVNNLNTEPMGIITLLDRSSENIKYVGQGGCTKRRQYHYFENQSAQLMFFESEIGAVIALVSCSREKIHLLEIHPKHLSMHFKIYYGEWGIVGFVKEKSEWQYTCEHNECAKYLSPEEKVLWLKDYQNFDEVLKATYVLRSRIPISK